MLRPTWTLMASAALSISLAAGCGGSGRPAARNAANGGGSGNAMDPPAEAMSDTQLAAYAGGAKFPQSRPRDDWKVAAIVSQDRKSIKVYNFEDQPLRTVAIWVNGAYVQPIQMIPPHARTVIHTDKLFNAAGDTFAKRSPEVSQVQLETRDGLFNLLGPATE